MVDEHLRRNNIWEVTTEQGVDGVRELLQQSEECPKATEEWRVGLNFGLLTIQCMVQEWPPYHVNSFTQCR